ncbi:putative Rossmann-fold NAD(P)-binding protein [Candidatus Hepatincolaceae symbiont of Richtersius coronifer]
MNLFQIKNLAKINICILGSNKALGSNLPKALASQGASVVLVTDDSQDLTDPAFKDTLNKITVIDFQNPNSSTALEEADIIINLTLCPTPANLNKRFNHKLNFSKNMLKKVKPQQLYIHISPLINKNIFSFFYKTINHINELIKHTLINYRLISIAPVASNADSLINDINTLITKVRVFPRFKNKDFPVAFLQRDTLITALILIITDYCSTKEYEQQEFELAEATATLGVLNKKISELIGVQKIRLHLPIFLIRLLRVPLRIKLQSFHSNYFQFIQLQKKSSANALSLKDLPIKIFDIDYIITTCLRYLPKDKNEDEL